MSKPRAQIWLSVVPGVFLRLTRKPRDGSSRFIGPYRSIRRAVRYGRMRGLNIINAPRQVPVSHGGWRD